MYDADLTGGKQSRRLEELIMGFRFDKKKGLVPDVVLRKQSPTTTPWTNKSFNADFKKNIALADTKLDKTKHGRTVRASIEDVYIRETLLISF